MGKEEILHVWKSEAPHAALSQGKAPSREQHCPPPSATSIPSNTTPWRQRLMSQYSNVLNLTRGTSCVQAREEQLVHLFAIKIWV